MHAKGVIMIKKILLLTTILTLIQADVKPENVIAGGCLKSYQKEYLSFKEHKVFVYARESDTNKDKCGWNYNNSDLEVAKREAMKQCSDHPLDAPCVIVDVDGKFLVKKGEFSYITPPDTRVLSTKESNLLKSRAKKQVAGSCYPFFEKYLEKKGHKTFYYTLDEDGRFACGDTANHYSEALAKKSGLKGCENHKKLIKQNAPSTACKIYALGNTIVVDESEFSSYTPPSNKTLSKDQKQAIMIEAKKSIIGNCLPFFEKYLTYNAHKAFAYAIDKDGIFSCGQGNGYTSKKLVNQKALEACAKDHPNKHPKSACKVYASGNKILLFLKDYNISKGENIIKNLTTAKRDALYEKVAMFIDSSSCRSALRIYLYPHQQQAFYAAIDKDGKQACGFSYAKFSLEDAKKSANKSCEKKKDKLKIKAICKPLFINLKILSKEKDFGIKRGKEDYKNALSHGNLIKIKSYIDEGMDVNIVNKDGVGALFVSAAQGDFDFFQKLIKKGANIKPLAQGTNSMLTAASLGGDANIVRYLIKKGLDINHQGSGKNTPLHASFMMLKTYIVEILMQEGADATIKNAKGISAYDLAKKWKMNLDELKTIDPKKPDHEGTLPLFYAAKEGDIEGIKKLLAKGAEINNADSEKRSPLCYAHIRVLEMLVKAGADVNHQDEDGITPLMVNSDNKSKIELLLKLGADKSIKDKQGKTAYDEVKDDKSVSEEIKSLLKP